MAGAQSVCGGAEAGGSVARLALATVLAVAIIVADFFIRYPKDLNVPPPLALLFYPPTASSPRSLSTSCHYSWPIPLTLSRTDPLTLNAFRLRVDVSLSVVLLRVLAYLVGGHSVGGVVLAARERRVSRTWWHIHFFSEEDKSVTFSRLRWLFRSIKGNNGDGVRRPTPGRSPQFRLCR